MNNAAEVDAWTRYWRRSDAGCMPGAPPALAKVLEQTWHEFARSLPKNARLLDLATGNGAVARAVAAVRSDLNIVGVDMAAPGTTAAPGSRLTGVDCAALPFGDGSFEAVTSQFGIEYCGTNARSEAVRVLASGGVFRLVVHDKSGIQLRQGEARLAALAALIESGLFGLARRIANGIAEDAGTASAIAASRSLHKDQSVVDELPQAVGLALRSAAPLPAITAIEGEAFAETVRLRAMVAAACSSEEAAAMRSAFLADGVDCQLSPLAVKGLGQIAWLFSGRKT